MRHLRIHGFDVRVEEIGESDVLERIKHLREIVNLNTQNLQTAIQIMIARSTTGNVSSEKETTTE